jgi:hypothetical protein
MLAIDPATTTSVRTVRVLLALAVSVATTLACAKQASARSGFEPQTGSQIRSQTRPNIEALVTRPTAVEGAPLLIPVRVAPAVGSREAARGASGVALSLRLASGALVGAEGQVVWPVRPRLVRDSLRRWASASNELRLVDAQSTEFSAGSGGDAFLAIEFPPEAPTPREILLGQQVITPRWLAPAPPDLLDRLAVRASAIVPAGEPDALLSRPDPDAPFERFRFEIGQRLRGWSAPPPFDATSPNGIAARATTALWLAALARVAQSSEGVAVEFAESLVATCADDTAPAPIAAWIADPTELSALLTLALDPARDGEALAEAIATWLRVRSPLLMWIEAEDGASVTLAIANPGTDEEIVRLAWLDAVWLDADSAPLAALIQPAEVARVRLERPLRPDIGDARSALRIEHRGQARTVPIVPVRLAAGASGPLYAAFQRSLDLVSAASGALQRAPESMRTVASLRPRLEGWEVFAEVHCPGGPTQHHALVVAGANGTHVVVRGDGSVEDADALIASLGPDAAVEFRAFSDRFRVSFALPSAWIERVDAAAIAEIGFRRIAPEGQADAPLASVPWRRLPRTVRVDLLAR